MAAKLAPLACALLLAACSGTDRPVAVEVPSLTAQADPPPPSSADVPLVAAPTAPMPPREEPASTAIPVSTANPTVAAEMLFNEGKRLMSQGQTAEACKKFQASMSLDPALGTMVNWAACKEKLGDKQGACDHYKYALKMAQHRGDAREQYVQSKVVSLGCKP